MGRLGRVIALEYDMTVTPANVQGFLIFKMIFILSDFYGSGAADIDNAELPALGEIISPEDLWSGEKKFLIDGDGTSSDDAVEHRIYHVDLIRSHDLFHKILFPDTLGVIMLGVEIARSLANLTIQFHIQLFWLFSDIC